MSTQRFAMRFEGTPAREVLAKLSARMERLNTLLDALPASRRDQLPAAYVNLTT